MRLLAFILCLSLAPPLSALEIVLRDTIGPDGSATNNSNSRFANTNQVTGFSSPGIRVTNASGKLGKLTEIKTVLIAKVVTADQPINDLNRVKELEIEAHIWQDGLEGSGDSYDGNPAGTDGISGHVVQAIDYITNASLEVLSSGNGDGYDTYLLTVDVSPLQIQVQPDQELIFSTMQFISQPIDDLILMNFSRSFYEIDDVFIEDVFQNEVTRPFHRPGYVNTQLGLNGFNYGAYASIAFLEADYNNDGTVDLADYNVWRNHLGATSLDAWYPGDGNGDGDITVADYDVWRNQFGMSLADLSASNANSVNVPEPTAAILLSLGLLITFRLTTRTG